MPREIEVGDDALRIRYSGLIHFFLGRELVVPYADIESVGVGLEAQPFYSPNMRRRTQKGRIVRGRFKSGGRWYFLDFHHRERVVQIVMREGTSRYSVIGIEPDGDSDDLVREIRAKL
jgi:hypothetical protein